MGRSAILPAAANRCNTAVLDVAASDSPGPPIEPGSFARPFLARAAPGIHDGSTSGDSDEGHLSKAAVQVICLCSRFRRVCAQVPVTEVHTVLHLRRARPLPRCGNESNQSRSRTQDVRAVSLQAVRDCA